MSTTHTLKFVENPYDAGGRLQTFTNSFDLGPKQIDEFRTVSIPTSFLEKIGSPKQVTVTITFEETS